MDNSSEICTKAPADCRYLAMGIRGSLGVSFQRIWRWVGIFREELTATVFSRHRSKDSSVQDPIGEKMGTPLHRAWHSIRRTTPDPTQVHHPKPAFQPSQCLPADVLASVFSRLSVQELAAASMVCKSWRDCAAQEHLWQKLLQHAYTDTWEHLLFAETKLRFGPAFR